MISRNNLAFGLFALLVLSVGLVSAATLEINNVVSPSSVAENASSFPFTFNITYTGVADVVSVSFNKSTVTFGQITASNITLLQNESKIVNGTVNSFADKGGQTLGAIINASTNTSAGAIGAFSVSITDVSTVTPSAYEFCNWNGSRGFENGTDLEIRAVSDNKVDNEKEWAWRPLDNVEVEVKVKNSGDNDEDYVVEIVFLDGSLNTADIAKDEDDLTEDISIDSGDSETVTFNFTITGDVDSGSYDMYVKVYQDGDEKIQCVSRDSRTGDIDDITIKKDKRDVIVKSVSGMNNVKAGSIVTYEVDIANLGREDEDQVKILAYNSELGINQFVEIEGLDSGDSETVTLTVKYPADADEGSYKLKFSTEYNYDTDSETYDDESVTEDDYTLSVGILAGAAKPTIGADLESEAKIGEQLILKTTITNNGASGNFIVSVTGYESWADLVSVVPQTATLAKGESIEVLVTLVPKTSGFQSFKVNAIVGGETYSQSVSVNIPVKEGGIFSDVSSTMVYLIGGIVALIVIILLVLIIKLARSPKRKVSDY